MRKVCADLDGDILYGVNEAFGGRYILGYTVQPEHAQTGHDRKPGQILLWHSNYHPDGGQLFFPLDRQPFVVPPALTGENLKPGDWVCFFGSMD